MGDQRQRDGKEGDQPTATKTRIFLRWQRNIMHEPVTLHSQSLKGCLQCSMRSDFVFLVLFTHFFVTWKPGHCEMCRSCCCSIFGGIPWSIYFVGVCVICRKAYIQELWPHFKWYNEILAQILSQFLWGLCKANREGQKSSESLLSMTIPSYKSRAKKSFLFCSWCPFLPIQSEFRPSSTKSWRAFRSMINVSLYIRIHKTNKRE